MTSSPRVVYWNNQPSPYVVARLNAVADHGNVQVHAWFDGTREADRSWDVDPSTWRFPATFLKPRRVLGRDRIVPTRELVEHRPDLLVTNYDRLHMMLGATASLAVSGRTAVRALPTFPAWDPPSTSRTLARKLLFRAVDGAKVPGPDGMAYAARHGLPPERSFPVTQSIDVDLYANGASVPASERERGRAELGLEGCVFVYSGRIWSGKGLDTLFAAFRDASSRSCEPMTLLMVGDGVDMDRYRAETADLPGVVWAGFAQAPEMARLYGLADVLVFPTLGDPNGLVVEEAMAAGLPVIASDAAGDIRARVVDGVTGTVLPAGEAWVLAYTMVEFAAAAKARARMGARSRDRVEAYRVEAYARDFEQFVEQTLATPRRRGLVPALGRLAGRALLATSH